MSEIMLANIDSHNPMAVFSDILEKMGDAYTSIDLTVPENKIKLYNAINTPSDRITDIINKRILMVDAVTIPAQTVDEKTGEARYIVRSIIIDKEGNTYTASSNGLHNSLRNILAIFGTLHFDQGLPVTVKQVETKRGRTLTLKLD